MRTSYKVTDNRIGAPTIFETNNGRECYAWILANCSEFRLYHNEKNVAVGFVEPTGLSVRTSFPSVSSLFED